MTNNLFPSKSSHRTSWAEEFAAEATRDEFDIHPEAVEVLPPMTVEELDTFLTEEDLRSKEEAGIV